MINVDFMYLSVILMMQTCQWTVYTEHLLPGSATLLLSFYLCARHYRLSYCGKLALEATELILALS